MKQITRTRLQLVLIAALFLVPFLAAVLMRFGGWDPSQTRNHGVLLQPPLPMASVEAEREDGERWVLANQDRQWSLLVRVPENCGQTCRERIELLATVRESQGRHAGKLWLFALDPAPNGFPPLLSLSGDVPPPLRTPLQGELPELWMVDHNGFLIMHYPADFDPTGLRRDLSRLVR